ncbi:MAG TPA: PD-(D/E)XK nuclease family protein [Stenomitos sp.]
MQEASVLLSEESLALFERCPLAYYYEHVEHRSLNPDAAHRVEMEVAAHEAAAAVLRAGMAPDSPQVRTMIEEIMARHELTVEETQTMLLRVIWAVRYALSRKGGFRWIGEEHLLERIPGATVRANFDVAVIGGKVAPIEIIHWVFGGQRLETSDELKYSVGAAINRLVASALEPDTGMRPIAVTEVHVPSGTAVTAVPDDPQLIGAYLWIEDQAQMIHECEEKHAFTGRPGSQCAACEYAGNCQTCPACNFRYTCRNAAAKLEMAV